MWWSHFIINFFLQILNCLVCLDPTLYYIILHSCCCWFDEISLSTFSLRGESGCFVSWFGSIGLVTETSVASGDEFKGAHDFRFRRLTISGSIQDRRTADVLIDVNRWYDWAHHDFLSVLRRNRPLIPREHGEGADHVLLLEIHTKCVWRLDRDRDL